MWIKHGCGKTIGACLGEGRKKNRASAWEARLGLLNLSAVDYGQPALKSVM
jgi:hypothetical protein